MKRILLVTTAFLVTLSLYGQSKKMLISNVTSTRNHSMGMNAQTEAINKDGIALYPQQVIEYSNMVQNNKEFDQTPLSNKLDKFLIEEFFTDFPVQLESKSKILENEKYQAFESPYFSGKPAKNTNSGLGGKLNKLAELDNGSSSQEAAPSNKGNYRDGGDPADGYKTFFWSTIGNNESDEIWSYFPETDIFVSAIYGGNLNSTDYGKEASFACSVQLVFYKRGKKKNNKVFQFLGNKTIADYSFEKYVSEPDIDAIYKVREECLDQVIETMKSKKEKRKEQFQKWIEK